MALYLVLTPFTLCSHKQTFEVQQQVYNNQLVVVVVVVLVVIIIDLLLPGDECMVTIREMIYVQFTLFITASCMGVINSVRYNQTFKKVNIRLSSFVFE
jgi:hypothetical protein